MSSIFVQPVLSVVIPCYNSQQYMEKAISSVLDAGMGDCEVIIVDDGSQDRTAEIADGYAMQFPDRVRVIHQANKGHGGAVNAGIKVCRGVYVKILDSDDFLDAQGLQETMSTLRNFICEHNLVDVVIGNYVYEKAGALRRKVMRYTSVIPRKKVVGWNDIKRFPIGKYLMMHSIIYRTEILRDCRLELPEHTFYVDNLYVALPLNHTYTLYYMDVDLYHYSIGREDQSVNEAVMIRRIDQQLKVNKLLIDYVCGMQAHSPRLEQYLYHHLEIVTAISSILLIRSGDEGRRRKDEFWKYIKDHAPELYVRLYNRPLGFLVNLSGTPGKKIPLAIYKVARRLYKFN